MTQFFIPPEVLLCIWEGLHLTSCDEDGYCNYCGFQDNPNEEDEED